MLQPNQVSVQAANNFLAAQSQPSICFPKVSEQNQRPTVSLVLEDLGQRLA